MTTPRWKRGAAACVVALLVVAGPLIAQQAGAAVLGDGTTSETAGASCWGIKQQVPSSPDGLYWLQTPDQNLFVPQQFYCDMTTDGGGWVLVGRGREGWTFSTAGQGSAANIRNTPTGTAAFTPSALPSATIDGLLNGGDVNALADGIRVRRALNATGTQYQELRLRMRDVQNWSWAFGAGLITNSIRIGTTTYNGGQTRDTAINYGGQTTNQLRNENDEKRLWTYENANKNYMTGWAYGSTVSGANNATSYLWTYTNERNALPFAQVFIRPQIANNVAGHTPIPAGGFAAEAKPTELKLRNEPNPWGVTGLDHTNEAAIEPWNTPVVKVFPLGDRVFVGGRFTSVVNGSGGATTSQPFLAAFDRATGNWIDTFRPVLDGRVWDMEVTADGKLLIAGDFTTVNGDPATSALAALNPLTGQLDPTWRAHITRTGSTERAIVRAIDVSSDGFVYAAGRFNQVKAGTFNTITRSSAVKLNAANANPVTAWAPQLPAAAADLTVSADLSKVYMVGYFANVSGDTNMGNYAWVSSTTGASVPGVKPWVPSTTNAKYQLTVTDLGNGKVVQGGSEHDLQMYTDTDRTLVQTHITRNGGDLQSTALVNGKLYAACHCWHWNYQGANNYSAPVNYSKAEPVNGIGRFSTDTLEHESAFYTGGLDSVSGEGVWSLAGDSANCLWFGGDVNRGAYTGNPAIDWTGNFGRFCPDDSQVPTTPASVNGTVNGGTLNLSWGSSTDNAGSDGSNLSYLVYRDDRVIARVTGGTQYALAAPTAITRYTVRATDARGNLSGSPAPVSIAPASAVVSTPIAASTAWKYSDTGADLGTAWRANGFDDTAWASGNAELGWGDGDEATVIGASMPTTSYYRKTFNLANTNGISSLQLGLVADDGAVVYLNGTEVGRFNMPTGTVSASTLAATFLSGAGEAAFNAFTIPKSLLVAGTNTVAVEVHQAQALNADSSFNLRLDAMGPNGDATAPSAPNLSTTGGTQQINLSWTASTDNFGVAGYIIARNGSVVSVVPATTTTYSDTGLGTDATHSYTVTAFDAAGLTATSNSSSATTAPAPDTTAPVAAITSPTNGASVSGTVNVTATASDAVGVTSLELRVDGVPVGSTTTAPYSISWDATTLGTHTLQVFASDAAGNTGSSPAVTVNVPDTTAPATTVTAPANGASIITGTTEVTATAIDNVGVSSVELRVDGVPVATSALAPYSFSWNAAVGAHTLQTFATDAAGNVGQSAVVNVTVLPVPTDTTAPTTAITSPADAAVIGIGSSVVTATAADAVGVTSVELRVDGVAADSDNSAPYSFTWDAAAGAHTLQTFATDAAGNVGQSAVVNVTASAPTSTLFADLFSAANGSAWGSNWTTTSGSGTADIQGNRGALSFSDTAGGFARAALSGLADRTDSDTTLSYQWSANTAVGYFSAFTRGSGGWANSYRPRNGYGVELSSNSGSISVKKVVNGTVTTVRTLTGLNTTTTAKQWLRLRVVGDQIQVKKWLDGQAEPTAWNSTDTDTQVTAAGDLHLSYVRGGSNSGAKSVFIDDVTVATGDTAPPAPDTSAPTAPAGLASSNVTQSTVQLAWSAATDNIGVTGYQLVRDGAVVATVPGLSTTDTGLAAGSSHTYLVRAIDAAGNVSGDSNLVNVTMAAPSSSLFEDLFTAANGTAWGSSWTTTTGFGTADIQGNRGALSFSDSAGGFARAALSGLADRADSDTTFSYQWSANTGVGYFSAFTRGSGGWANSYRPRNGYGVELSSNSGSISVKKVVNGTTTTVRTLTGLNTTTTAKQWLRIRVVGNTIQIKKWLDGQAEPTAWNSTDTDADVTAAGDLHLSYVRGGSNIGAKSVFIDDLTVNTGA